MYLYFLSFILYFTTIVTAQSNTLYTFTSTLPYLTSDASALYQLNSDNAAQYNNISNNAVLSNVVVTQYNNNLSTVSSTTQHTDTSVQYVYSNTYQQYVLLYVGISPSIVLYTQPTQSNVINTTKSVFDISSTVQYTADTTNIPYIQYTTLFYTCNTVLPMLTPNISIQCSQGNNVVASISLLTQSIGATGSSVTLLLNVSNSISTESLHTLQTLTLYQLQQTHYKLLTSNVISLSNINRRNSTILPVAFFWAFIIIILIISAYIGTVWLHFIIHSPIPQYVLTKLHIVQYIHINHIVWCTISLVLFAVLIKYEGLFGVVLVLLIYLLGSIICTTIYLAIQFTRGEYFKLMKQSTTMLQLSKTQVDPNDSALNITMLLSPSDPHRVPSRHNSVPDTSIQTNQTDSIPSTHTTPDDVLVGNELNYTLDTPLNLPLPYYTVWPRKLSEYQNNILWYGWIALIFVVLCCLALFQIWSNQQYYVYDRMTQNSVIEIQPSTIAKSTSLVYAFDGFANSILQVNKVIFPTATHVCGMLFNQTLQSDTDKYNNIYLDYIVKYNVDMTQYNPSDYLQYSTVNQWFARQLAPGARPIASLYDDTVIISPADARTIVFDTIEQTSQFWLKGTQLSSYDLLTARGYIAAYDQSSLAITRLAPQDYHRFHSPVTGVITDIYTIQGGYHSVNADAMQANDNAIMNVRTVILINTTSYSNIGTVAYVAVGALCIASIQLDIHVNEVVTKGQEIGYFQFGGSSIVTLYEQGTIQWDTDISMMSQNYGVETFVQMGQQIATVINTKT